jgi:hypothetical protein
VFTKIFWKDLTERAIATGAESALLVVGGGALNAFDADWRLVAGAALGGAALAVIKGLAASLVGEQTPSFARLSYQGKHEA